MTRRQKKHHHKKLANRKSTRPVEVTRAIAHGAISPEHGVEIMSSIPGGKFTSAYRKACERVIGSAEHNTVLESLS